MSVWLATSMFSEVLNGACEHWPVEAIPPGVLVWLSRYASNLPRSDSYESKLYLRLRGQLPRRINPKTTTRLMIPLCLPARITKPAGRVRFARYSIEASYSWRRLRFHLFDGIHFGIEALCWEWRLPKVQRRPRAAPESGIRPCVSRFPEPSCPWVCSLPSPLQRRRIKFMIRIFRRLFRRSSFLSAQLWRILRSPPKKITATNSAARDHWPHSELGMPCQRESRGRGSYRNTERNLVHLERDHGSAEIAADHQQVRAGHSTFARLPRIDH